MKKGADLAIGALFFTSPWALAPSPYFGMFGFSTISFVGSGQQVPSA